MRIKYSATTRFTSLEKPIQLPLLLENEVPKEK
jgi:hypothetical protein